MWMLLSVILNDDPHTTGQTDCPIGPGKQANDAVDADTPN